MAPNRADSPSASEDEVPETFSFDASKKAAKGEQIALQQHQVAVKRKRKRRNRERDRRLKDNAAQAKAGQQKESSQRKGTARAIAAEESNEEGKEEGQGKGGDGGRDDLEARMQRAMREAEEESGGEDEAGDVEWDGIGGTGGAGKESDSGKGGPGGKSVTSEKASNSPEDEDPAPPKASCLPACLPDHLFRTAFTETGPASGSKRKLDGSEEVSDTQPIKRKRKKRPGKDLVVGSRRIRTLATPSPALPPATTPRALIPPARVNKFLSRTLNLKSKPEATKLKGWERRTANVGVMKRNGPAASFVRDDGYT